MWHFIGIWTLATLAACVLAAVLLRMRRIGSKPNFINLVGGLALGRGFRLTNRLRLNGDRQLIVATLAAWLMWALLGSAIIALVSPGYQPGYMFLVYGLLCGLAGAVIGFFLALAGAAAYAKATRMSNFEGAAGYFIVLMGLLGGVVIGLASAIGMTIFFHSQGH